MTLIPETPTRQNPSAPPYRSTVRSTSKKQNPVIPVDVRFTADGAPLAVRYDGRVWPVAAEPEHWFGRHVGWAERLRAPAGSDGLFNEEYWRVRIHAGTASSPLRTFELRRDPQSKQWLLESVSDLA